jgi:acyl dehydratase
MMTNIVNGRCRIETGSGLSGRHEAASRRLPCSSLHESAAESSAAAESPGPAGERPCQSVSAAPYLVTSERIVAYAHATNDSHPQHLSGKLAPPSFAIIPILQTMVAAKNLVTPAFGFHGEHDFWFHRPIRPGMRLISQARVHGVQQRFRRRHHRADRDERGGWPSCQRTVFRQLRAEGTKAADVACCRPRTVCPRGLPTDPRQ